MNLYRFQPEGREIHMWLLQRLGNVACHNLGLIYLLRFIFIYLARRHSSSLKDLMYIRQGTRTAVHHSFKFKEKKYVNYDI